MFTEKGMTYFLCSLRRGGRVGLLSIHHVQGAAPAVAAPRACGHEASHSKLGEVWCRPWFPALDHCVPVLCFPGETALGAGRTYSFKLAERCFRKHYTIFRQRDLILSHGMTKPSNEGKFPTTLQFYCNRQL